MARRKNLPDSVRTKCRLAERLRAVRAELYGERGGPELARRLGLPIRTWYNYEAGVTVPAEVVLRFVELTAVEPFWLLHGQGPKFRSTPPGGDGAGSPTDSVEDLLRTALQRLEQRELRAEVSACPEPAGRNGTPDEGQDAHHDMPQAPDRDWLIARRDGRCLRIEGDAMVPIVADGAEVAFSDAEEDAEALEGRLVVAWVEGSPVVRWFERSGKFAMLRAENPGPDTGTILIDLEGPAERRRFRRVTWIGTRH